MTDTHRDRAPRKLSDMALIFDRGDRYIAANMLDISETGLRLRGDETAPVGKQVTLYADLNDRQSWPIHIEGLVVRNHGQEMGVRFMYDSVSQLTQMRLFVQAVGEQAMALQAAAESDDDAGRDSARWDEAKKKSSGDDKHPKHSDDDTDETPDGEPTFESLSDAERRKEIEGETEAAEGEGLDTVDQHELNRAEEREDKADEKAQENADDKAHKASGERDERDERGEDACEVDDDADGERDDDEIVRNITADLRAWTTLAAGNAVSEADFGALNADRELTYNDDREKAPDVVAYRAPTTEEIFLEEAALLRPRALRASLRNVYGILDLEERYCAGTVLDLSETGFFIATDEQVELGQDITFIPHDMDDESLPLELNARVVRVQDPFAGEDRPRGVACRLTRLSLQERDALKGYLRSKYIV